VYESFSRSSYSPYIRLYACFLFSSNVYRIITHKNMCMYRYIRRKCKYVWASAMYWASVRQAQMTVRISHLCKSLINNKDLISCFLDPSTLTVANNSIKKIPKYLINLIYLINRNISRDLIIFGKILHCSKKTY